MPHTAEPELQSHPPYDQHSGRVPVSAHRTLSECQGNVSRFLDQYRRLRMSCPQCEVQVELQCPVRLHGQSCVHCGHPLDPMEWHETGPVHHRLMRRLIRTCYRHPAFAQRVLNHYRRDLDRSVAPEWGIDKGLLLVHAANAVLQHGHRSVWVFLSCLLGLFPILGLIPLWLMKRRMDLNEQCAALFEPAKGYQPSALLGANFEMIGRILHFANGDYPHNIFFFNAFAVFDTNGQLDGQWSFLVDRRKQLGGGIADEPLSFDVNYVLNRIVERTTRQGGPGNYPGRYRAREVIMVRGPGLEASDRRFLDARVRPRYRVSDQLLEAERGKHEARARVYTQIASYDPEDDVGLTSYVRLEHRGAFTYIESIGTRLLPVAQRLFNAYSAEPTSRELQEDRTLLSWLRAVRLITRRRVFFIGIAFAVACFAWSLSPGGLGGLASVAVLLVAAAFTYGPPLRLHDKFEPRQRSLLLSIVPGVMEERERKKALELIEDQKTAAEFNYGPTLYSIRASQARGEETQLDTSDLRVLRRSQELTIQDTFVECLEEAGIDTSDFREAAAQINNYGIINSGQIGGDAKNEQGGAEASNQRGARQTTRESVQNTLRRTSIGPSREVAK